VCANTGPYTRVLQFPEDRSLGTLLFPSDNSNIGLHSRDWEWESGGEAQGQVLVPLNRQAWLYVSAHGWQDLSPVIRLQPDALDAVVISSRLATNDDMMRKYALPKAQDKYLDHVCALTGLKTLQLRQTDITNDGLQRLGQLSSLQWLSVSASHLDATGIKHIARLKSLRILELQSKQPISKDDLSFVSTLTLLEELFLSGNKFDTDGLLHLKGLPELRKLCLYLRNIDASGLAHVAEIPFLEELKVGRIGNQEALLQQIANCANMKTLLLQDIHKGTPLTYLARMRTLRVLYLYSCSITDVMLAGLVSIPHLKTIDISGGIGFDTGITDKGLEALSKITSLESVHLAGGRYTDKGLEYLSQLKNLKRLEIPNNRKFTDEGLKYLSQLPNLEELLLSGNNLTKSGILYLAQMRSLKKLEFLSPVSQQCLDILATIDGLDFRIWGKTVDLSQFRK